MPNHSKSSSKSKSSSSSSTRSRKSSKFASKFARPKQASQIFDRVVSGPYEKMAMQTAMRTVQEEFIGKPPQAVQDKNYEEKHNIGIKFEAHPVRKPSHSPGTANAFRGQRIGTRRIPTRPTNSPTGAYRGTRRSGIRK